MKVDYSDERSNIISEALLIDRIACRHRPSSKTGEAIELGFAVKVSWNVSLLVSIKPP